MRLLSLNLLVTHISYVSMDEFISVKDHQIPRLPYAFSDPFI